MNRILQVKECFVKRDLTPKSGSEVGGLGTIKVEPPIANEVILVEDGSVGAQEGVLGEGTIGTIGTSSADMKDLTFGLGISVVTCNFQSKMLQTERNGTQSDIPPSTCPSQVNPDSGTSA